MRAQKAALLAGCAWALSALAPAFAQTVTETYAYDPLGRLVSATSGDGKQTLYALDPADNRQTTTTSATATVQPPTADPVTFTVPYGSPPLTFDPRVYASDPVGSPLTVAGATQPILGASASVTASSITYTLRPTPVQGQDHFIYTVKNAAGLYASGLVTVILTISPPVANPDSYSYVFGSGQLAFDPRANDSDPSGASLTIAGVGAPQRGSVSTDGSTIVYTPPADHSPGQDSFSYTLQDSLGQSAIGTINIALSNALPAAVDDAISVPFGGSTTFDPASNDNDASNNPLTVTAVTPPAHGSTSLANGLTTYTAAAGYSGGDSFGYTVSDAYGTTASGTVGVTVLANANQPPTASGFSMDVQGGHTLTQNVCTSGYASDPDGDTLTISSVSNPSKGSVSFSGCSITYHAPTVASFTSTSFTYTVADPHGATSSPATVNVTIESTQ